MNGTKQVGLTIDGLNVQAAEGTNVLRAAEQAGIAIPHFCYHPGLEVEGSCRMCLVEIEGLPKLELACSTRRPRRDDRPDLDGTGPRGPQGRPRVPAGRASARLPHLRQGGGVPAPGLLRSPRALRRPDGRGPGAAGRRKLPIGRGLLLDRERCILCTRCVRFLRQVTGTGELGVFERAVRSEVGIYDGAPVDNNYSGNLVDICPVGAITAEDFRFKTRAWFLARRPTVCPHCGRGCAVVIESVEGYPLRRSEKRVYRVTARENPAVNGFWICDLGRDGRHDIDDGRHAAVSEKGAPVPGLSWQKALADVAAAIRSVPGPERAGKIAVILNSRLTCEELALAKRLFVTGLGLGKVFFADRKPGAADGLLLTAERVPNARGVLEAGFSPRLPDLEELAGAEVLLVFGSALAATFRRRGDRPDAGRRSLRNTSSPPTRALSTGSSTSFSLSPFRLKNQALTSTSTGSVSPSPGPSGRAPESSPKARSSTCLANALGIDLGDTDAR